MCGSGPQSVSHRLFLKHQLAARLDGVIFLCCCDVAHGAGAPLQSSVPGRLRVSRLGHPEDPRQTLQEELKEGRRVKLLSLMVIHHCLLSVCCTLLVQLVMTCVLGVLKCRLRTTTQLRTTTVTRTMMNIRYLRTRTRSPLSVRFTAGRVCVCVCA